MVPMRWIAALTLAARLTAQNPPHPIDARMKACTAAHPSTHGESQCFAAAEKEWDGELNRAYGELRANSTAAERTQLLAAQKAWLAFRDAEFALIDRVYGGREGTMFIPMRAYRRMEVVRERARDLAAYAQLPR